MQAAGHAAPRLRLPHDEVSALDAGPTNRRLARRRSSNPLARRPGSEGQYIGRQILHRTRCQVGGLAVSIVGIAQPVIDQVPVESIRPPLRMARSGATSMRLISCVPACVMPSTAPSGLHAAA